MQKINTMITNKTDLSYINSVNDLKTEIQTVRKRVKAQERDLNERLNKLPQEGIKAAVSSVVPSFIGNFLPGKSIGIITGLLGMFMGKGSFENGGWKGKATDIARQVSLYAIVKGAYTFFKKRKTSPAK